MQYTNRGIPERIDTVLRKRARAEGLGVGSRPKIRRDLGDIAGTWTKDAEAEAALASHDRIDSRLFK